MPSIERLHDDYKARGLDVLLVNMREEPDLVRRTSKSRGYLARIVLDASGEVARDYAVVGTPTVFLIARTGLIAGRAIGRREWAGSAGRAVIEALLAEKVD